MAKKDAAAPEKEGRLKQIALVYKMTKKTDPRIGLILLGVFLLTAAIAFGVFTLVPGSWIDRPIEVPPASRAPLLPASMMPGPPPVITGWPRSTARRPISTAA